MIAAMHNGFSRELSRFGPGRRVWVTRAQARQYCSRLARSHYENFTVASIFLPRPLLQHFHAIYAYCRWADDLGDETGGGPQAMALLRWWREELLYCYHGRPRHPVMVALQPTIRRFNIPPKPFLDLLFAFEQDQLIKEYQTFEQLLHYCTHSANPVGHLVLYLCEAFDETRAALADCICTGLQLANFWQDVARDLDIGRVYLPAEDRRHFGVSDADLYARRFTANFASLMHFEVERAFGFFHRGAALTDLMPRAVRPDIELFRAGGRAILNKIVAAGYNVLERRPVLSKWDKAALLLNAGWRKLAGLF
jgi:squalene synthase HpnC